MNLRIFPVSAVLIAKGAEAEIYLVDWFGVRAVMKWRKPKAYRDPSLDYQIRRRRTIAEVRNMYVTHTLGISVPAVYFFDPERCIIIMEYVEGRSLRDLIAVGEYGHLETAGYLVGVMHKAGLIHGDLAPTNMILSGGRLYFIDFGLGDLKKGWSKKIAVLLARDVNVLLRNLDAYGDKSGELKERFWLGYSLSMGERAIAVKKEVERIRASGRYAVR